MNFRSQELPVLTPEFKGKILIMLLGAIGDVVQALPLAVRIRRHCPLAQLDWAIEPRAFGIVRGHPYLSNVVIFERNGGIRAFAAFLRKLRSEHYDIVLDLQRHLKSGFAACRSGASRRIGFNPRNAKEFNWLFNTEHIGYYGRYFPKILYYQKFGDRLGVPPAEPLDYGLKFESSETDAAETLVQEVLKEAGLEPAPKERRVFFLIGSTWSSRVWPPEHYRELAKSLLERSNVVSVVVGGPADQLLAAEIAQGPAPIGNLTGKTSLRELANVFLCGAAAVGSDSGPMHLAAAVGLPVVSLWGPTSPKRSAPYGFENLVLQTGIGCSPCYRRNCPGIGKLCLAEIPPEAVLARINLILGKSKN